MIKRFELAGGAPTPVGQGSGPIQVYINPDAPEREALRSEFGVDDHTLSSALDPDEVARIEASPGRLLLIWKRAVGGPARDPFLFDVGSIGLVLAGDRLAIIAADDLPLNASGGRPAPALQTPLDVLLWLLSGTIQQFLGHLKAVKAIARELQQKINTSMENKHLIRMFNLSESLIYYINAIHSNGSVLARLRQQAEKEGLPAEAVALLDDLIIENDQCYKQAEIYSSVLSGLMDARGNLVNNNMNALLKKLTIINVVFLPLNLIASVGGMSEFSMMTAGMDWKLSYALFSLAMVAIGGVTALILKRIDPGGKPAPRRRAKAGS